MLVRGCFSGTPLCYEIPRLIAFFLPKVWCGMKKIDFNCIKCGTLISMVVDNHAEKECECGHKYFVKRQEKCDDIICEFLRKCVNLRL